MDTGMMRRTHLDGSGVRILRVDVVVVDQPGAGASGGVEEFANDAVVARQIPPPLLIVNRSLHQAPTGSGFASAVTCAA